MNKIFPILFNICFVLYGNIVFAKSQKMDTLYFEDSNIVLDSIQLNIKRDVLSQIESKYLSINNFPAMIIIDGILINNSNNLNWNRDTITGKFWDGHCGCYGYFFDENYESIKEIYYLNNFSDLNFNNSVLIRTKPISSDSKKKNKRKKQFSN